MGLQGANKSGLPTGMGGKLKPPSSCTVTRCDESAQLTWILFIILPVILQNI